VYNVKEGGSLGMAIEQVAKNKIPEFIHNHYEVYEWKHAIAILKQDYPQEWQDIIEVLTDFRLLKSAISVGGGRKMVLPLPT
jgi:hypothetical protein